MTKKRNLLLVSLFLVFGLEAMAPSALAQNVFTLSNNQNGDARAEGLTEAIGTITLTTVSTGTINTTSKFVITYSQPIATVDSVLVNCSGTKAAALCGGLTLPVISAQLTNGNKTLTLPFTTLVDLTGNTASPGTGLSVTVRCNVTSLYPAGGQVTAGVIASYISGTPLTTNGSLYPLAIVQPEPALLVSLGGFWKTALSETNVLICMGVIKHNKEYEDKFVVNVAEAFVYALTSESYEYFLDPGASYPTGTDVTNGTIITVTINNVPVGLGIEAEDPIPCSDYTGLPMYCLGGTLAVELSSPDVFEGTSTATTATFEYAVTSTDTGVFPENVNLPFKIWTKEALGSSGLPDVTVTVSKQPQYPPLTNAYKIPRFMPVNENATPLAVVKFTNCSSYLLYPFAVVAGPWDTLFGVANATMDPLGSSTSAELAEGTAVPQSGTCSFFYYGGTPGPAGVVTTPPTGPLATWTSASIPAGSFGGWDMAKLAWSPAIPPVGSTGYLFAICNFSNAQGYADILINGAGLTANNLSMANYLALVIPNPYWLDRSSNGNGMGEGAPTPLNIGEKLDKLLFYFGSGRRR